jgi:hypothetical protein
MDKNWLIRTKSNHILGPVSKEKVIELYHNHSIKLDDEVCSGNGFWFFIREEDMVKRFLIGDEVQTFNPISEAKDVLTISNTDDITLIGNVDLSLLNLGDEEKTKPVEASAEGPDGNSTTVVTPIATTPAQNSSAPDEKKK